MKIPSLGVLASTLVSAAGNNIDSMWDHLVAGHTGLRTNALSWSELPVWAGPVQGVDDVVLSSELRSRDCRNHRLAWMALRERGFRQVALEQIKRVGSSRVGLILGTSTSGIRSTEQAYAVRQSSGAWPEAFNYRKTHSADALCRFVAQDLGVTGPAVTVVAACASSAKVFILAQQWIAAGLVDSVIVGGVDSLCLSTLLGFNSLQLLTEDICRPFDALRSGISIGEAAGFVLLGLGEARVSFLGGGESSDAWSMTTPHPDGFGASEAMRLALKNTGLNPYNIGYVHAHGTASKSNDFSEAKALASVFGEYAVPVSGTKGVTGHTLGAAGITEAIITIKALSKQTLPPTTNTNIADADLKVDLVTQTRAADFCHAMTNNFGFGGANCSLIFERGA